MADYKSERAAAQSPAQRRNTRSKTLILQTLEELGGKHVTAEELFDMLKEKNTPVAKSTLYRFLSQLEQDGLLKKYFVGESACACYQFVGKNSDCHEHFHLLCRQCGEITHFEDPSLERLLKTLDSTNNFSIDIKDSPFYGTCTTCKRKDKQ
ncbi:MAG: transcriptional repressor [Clostridia bacterium]|nr:transcriptional repressor [Clostridia bacterium]